MALGFHIMTSVASRSEPEAELIVGAVRDEAFSSDASSKVKAKTVNALVSKTQLAENPHLAAGVVHQHVGRDAMLYGGPFVDAPHLFRGQDHHRWHCRSAFESWLGPRRDRPAGRAPRL